MPLSLLRRFSLMAALLSLLLGCNSQPSKPDAPAKHPPHPPAHAKMEAEPVPVNEGILDLRSAPSLDELIPTLASRRVVYVGETHTEMAHHNMQLAVIEKLHARGVPLAIGLEMFQAPYQAVLDRYVAGEIDDQTLVLESEWFDRWGYDFGLYRPILHFARAQGIPLVALNIPRETVDALRRKGMEGLSEQERASLPEQIDHSDLRYAARLRQVFEAHPGSESRDFERFLGIQLAWDEGMAEQVAEWLARHPDQVMVVIAGSGHLAYGSGIPSRVERRIGAPGFIMVPGNQHDIEPGLADFVYFRNSVPAPPRPLLGVLLEPKEQGLLITKVFPERGAAQAGLKEGDRILAADGHAVASVGELRARLLGRLPGDRVTLTVVPADAEAGASQQLDVTLGD